MNEFRSKGKTISEMTNDEVECLIGHFQTTGRLYIEDGKKDTADGVNPVQDDTDMWEQE